MASISCSTGILNCPASSSFTLGPQAGWAWATAAAAPPGPRCFIMTTVRMIAKAATVRAGSHFLLGRTGDVRVRDCGSERPILDLGVFRRELLGLLLLLFAILRSRDCVMASAVARKPYQAWR